MQCTDDTQLPIIGLTKLKHGRWRYQGLRQFHPRELKCRSVEHEDVSLVLVYPTDEVIDNSAWGEFVDYILHAPGVHLRQDDPPLHGLRQEDGHARPCPGAVPVDADHAGQLPLLAVLGERVELKKGVGMRGLGLYAASARGRLGVDFQSLRVRAVGDASVGAADEADIPLAVGDIGVGHPIGPGDVEVFGIPLAVGDTGVGHPIGPGDVEVFEYTAEGGNVAALACSCRDGGGHVGALEDGKEWRYVELAEVAPEGGAGADGVEKCAAGECRAGEARDGGEAQEDFAGGRGS